jgi:hypothetical protein
MTRTVQLKLLVLLAVAVAIAAPVVAYGRDSGRPRTERNVDALVALGSGFTFQGRLTDGGAPANGVYDLSFYLYDALTGGSQVGPAQTIGDVTATAGLFTVTLNFGDVFHGAQYFLGIQVRPGASTGAYTILTPREPVSAVPNAAYAVEAGSASGLQGVGVSAAAPASGDVLTFNGTTWGPAASGAGCDTAGICVYGHSNTGTGVYGTSHSGDGGSFTSFSGDALQIDGPIRVSGSRPAAFVHTHVTNTSPVDPATVIDNPATNNNPTAILIVTQLSSKSNPHPIGVGYGQGKWFIYNEDLENMPIGSKFNVLVINQ